MSGTNMFAAYVAAGVSVHPLRLDGSKAPSMPAWNQYRERFAEAGELERWHKQRFGIAMICGVRSGGLEAFDFDEDADATLNAWLAKLSADIRGELCVVETAGFGYHVPYRSTEVCGNVKIAMTEPRGENQQRGVLIESRGEGGYVVAVGSPLEVHSSGRGYVQVMGRPLPAVPMFTAEQRKAMWEAAASFDTRPDTREEFVRRRVSELRPAPEIDTTTPWGDFDARADWQDIIGPHGWHTTDGVHWVRPGKSFGVSAKIVEAKDGTEALSVFSTTAGELAADGAPETWGKFRAFARLNYRGNRSEAAKAAFRLGYGRKAAR